MSGAGGGLRNTPALSQVQDSFLSKLKVTLKDNQLALIIGIGSALTAVVAFGIYRHLSGKQTQPIGDDKKIEKFLALEMERLHDPDLTEEGALQKDDFFNLIFLIKLKTARKLNKVVGKKQRERVSLLENAL